MLEVDQTKLLEQIRIAFKTVSMEGHMPFDDRSYVSFLQHHDLTKVIVFPFQSEVSGFSQNGQARIHELAKSLRGKNAAWQRTVSNAGLANMITNALTHIFRNRCDGPITEVDMQAFDDRLARWFKSHETIRTHYIPCNLSPWPDFAFKIGPVRFHHLTDFPVADFAMTTTQFNELDEVGDLYDLMGLKAFMGERHSDWVAVIGVADHEPSKALVTADLSIDVAIAIIQLVTPFDHYRHAARSTSRMAPVWRPNIVRTSDGGGTSGRVNNQPGRIVAPEGMGVILKAQAQLVKSMGSRLEGYVDGASVLPLLDETWCNAAYWYHEAIAETLETVAIAKLETSIEVLFRSVNSSGSTKRLADGLEIFFGLEKDDRLPDGSMTAGEFAAAIVTARSRVLHGTWQTLTSDLPHGKGGTAISLQATEQFARLLLIHVSTSIDRYATSTEPIDEVEHLLNWLRSDGV